MKKLSVKQTCFKTKSRLTLHICLYLIWDTAAVSLVVLVLATYTDCVWYLAYYKIHVCNL